MRRLLIAAVVVILVIALVAAFGLNLFPQAGPGTPTTRASTTNTPSGIVQGLVVSGFLDKSEYARGENVVVHLMLVNHLSTQFSLTSPTQCVFGIEVKNSNGTVVYSSSQQASCTTQPYHATLPPLGRLNETATWNQASNTGQQIPAGKYLVFGYVSVVANGAQANVRTFVGTIQVS